MHILRPFLKPMFWAALLCAYLLAVMPTDNLLTTSDKTNHIVAFCTLTVLGALAYPRAPWWRIAGSLALFGAFIEFTQMIPALQRDGDILDWAADLLAIVFGLLIASVIRRLLPTLIEA